MSVAGAACSVSAILCDVPPPGAGLVTEKLSLPPVASKAAGTTTVSCVLLTKVVGSAVVPAVTTDEARKFVPVIVNVVSAAPAVSTPGKMVVSVGAGLPTRICDDAAAVVA